MKSCHKSCALRNLEDEIVIGNKSWPVLEWDCHAQNVLYMGICLLCTERHYYCGKTIQLLIKRIDQTRCRIRKRKNDQIDGMVQHFLLRHHGYNIDGNISVARISEPFDNEDDLDAAEADFIAETGKILKDIDKYHLFLNKKAGRRVYVD